MQNNRQNNNILVNLAVKWNEVEDEMKSFIILFILIIFIAVAGYFIIKCYHPDSLISPPFEQDKHTIEKHVADKRDSNQTNIPKNIVITSDLSDRTTASGSSCSYTTAKDSTSVEDNYFDDLPTRIRQTVPASERPAKIKECIRRLKEEKAKSPSFIGACVTIVALDAKEAIPELINLLDDEGKCYMAMVTLGGLGAREAIPKIMNLLDDEHEGLTALQTLVRLGAREAIPKIMTLLNDKYAEIRAAAAQSLSTLGAKEAIPEIMNLLNDESGQVRLVAACVLGDLGVKEVTIPELIKLLNDKSISVRLSAACALGDLGAKDVAIPELIKLLKTTGDISSSLYISAARALGRLNAREAIPELIKLLGDERGDVRRAAGDALGQLDDIEPILESTNQPIDDDSLWAYKIALSINPKDASAYLNMGCIYEGRLDNLSKALFYYTEYLELAPPDACERKDVERWIKDYHKHFNHSRSK
ncbi:MAG: HEAT repeat domain-containing protein [Planctomycetota bacterium]